MYYEMGMEYIYAALLLHEAGKEINEENIKKILTSVNIEANDAMIKALLAALEGVDLNKVKEEALAMPATVVTTTSAPQPQAKEEKKEEKVEEKKEEQALEGLSALFGF